MSKSSQETRRFRMHPKLRFDVIRRQAGTLAKAVLEGVMNSVDAGATVCRVTLTEEALEISDDGRGFRSRQEVEDWFEVFGQPHSEQEHKTYGTFRMGRGQLFAFGANVWQTGRFRMEVDIQQQGLDYQLLSVKGPRYPGCLIQVRLYERLYGYDRTRTLEDVAFAVRWCPVPVYLNGDLVTRNPADEKWSLVTDDAYIRYEDTQRLSVYNRGIHVMDLPESRLGTGGVIVSRQALQVNFARNDVQSSCEVWKRICEVVEQHTAKKLTQKKSLSDGERLRVAQDLLHGRVAATSHTRTKLFTAVTGRHYSISELLRHRHLPLTVAPKGSIVGDRLHRSKTAFVLADQTLLRFNAAHLGDLLAKCRTIWPKSLGTQEFHTQDFASLARLFNDSYQLLRDSDATHRERLWLDLLRLGESWMAQTIADLEEAKLSRGDSRRVLLGQSESRNAWTDGASFICVSRQFLQRHDFNLSGLYAVGRVLLHEMCHIEPSAEEHDHDQAFYEQFHDRSEAIGVFVSRALSRLPTAAASLRRKLTKASLLAQDQVTRAEEAVSGLTAASHAP